MPRPTIKFIALNLDQRETKQRLMSQVGALHGLYSVELCPKRNTRTLAQNAAWWAMVVEPFYHFLRDQDAEIYDREQVHALLKEKLLRVAVISKRTGEVIGYRTRSTTELSTEEFSDLFDRARAWLSDKFGIEIPDPDPYWNMREAVTP